MKVKICGLLQENEIQVLDTLGVDYGGIWFGIPEGKYNLADAEARSLLKVKTKKLSLVSVTFKNDFGEICSVIRNTQTKAIQLHGFQLPALIRKIKQEFQDELEIMKVLHIRNLECLESDLISRYKEAGADYFILDSYLSKKEIGSTGRPIDNSVLAEFVPVIQKSKTIIAGGISEKNIGWISEKINPYGVDIDSSVRTGDRIMYSKVLELLGALDAVKGVSSHHQTSRSSSNNRLDYEKQQGRGETLPAQELAK